MRYKTSPMLQRVKDEQIEMLDESDYHEVGKLPWWIGTIAQWLFIFAIVAGGIFIWSLGGCTPERYSPPDEVADLAHAAPDDIPGPPMCAPDAATCSQHPTDGSVQGCVPSLCYCPTGGACCCVGGIVGSVYTPLQLSQCDSDSDCIDHKVCEDGHCVSPTEVAQSVIYCSDDTYCPPRMHCAKKLGYCVGSYG